MDSLSTPIDLIDKLDPDAIREKLADLERQATALRILLRAALARRQGIQRRRPAQPATAEETSTHA
jgi:hypothetical protein